MSKPDDWNQKDWDKLVDYCNKHGLDIKEFID